jgi:hypothetical protein
MGLANMDLADLIGSLVGLLLTLAVFSYILGDNALFRIAVHVFIGAAAGYTAVMAVNNVIWPQLIAPLLAGSQAEKIFVIFPLLLSGLLIFKISPGLARLGNPAVAYLVAVGVATAIGGAIMGTIFPQMQASFNLFDTSTARNSGELLWLLFTGTAILVGTAATLIYFHFGARAVHESTPRRAPWIEALAWVGQIFIAITLGSVFAGVYAASLTAFVERLQFMRTIIFGLFS